MKAVLVMLTFDVAEFITQYTPLMGNTDNTDNTDNLVIMAPVSGVGYTRHERKHFVLKVEAGKIHKA